MPNPEYTEYHVDRYYDTPEKLKDYFVSQEGKVSIPNLSKRVSDITGYKLEMVKKVVPATIRAIMEILINCDNTKLPGILTISSTPTAMSKMGNVTVAEANKVFWYPTGMNTTLRMSPQLRHLRNVRLTSNPNSIAGRKGLVIAENQSTISRIMMFRYVFEQYFPEYKGMDLPLSKRRDVVSRHLVDNAHHLGDRQDNKTFKSKEHEDTYLQRMEQFAHENKVCVEYAPGKKFGEEYMRKDSSEDMSDMISQLFDD